MGEPYPLRFQPVFRRYLWGGRRLATVLNKPIGDEPCAESWEVVDHGDDQSVVTHGPAAGCPLGQLAADWGADLLGENQAGGQFPLLFKFLDAQQNLSVQVHPNDEQAGRLPTPDLGKTEAWVILAAEPGSLIYAGLKRGIDRDALLREVHRGTTELCLHKIEPRVGDCVFIPAGVVHAIGGGLLVAEIQQASDTTFRLHDWNRLGPDGAPRTLHIEQALDVIDYQRGGVEPQAPRRLDAAGERLVDCEKFVLDRLTLDGPRTIGGDGRFRILTVLEGAIQVSGDPSGEPLGLGQTALLPAGLGATEVVPQDPKGDASQAVRVLEMRTP